MCKEERSCRGIQAVVTFRNVGVMMGIGDFLRGGKPKVREHIVREPFLSVLTELFSDINAISRLQ